MSLNKYLFLKLLLFVNASIIFAQDFKEEVIVTGSLNSNLEVTNSVLEFSELDLKKNGVFRIEDFLNVLPIIDPSNSSLQSNNSIGISTISIRGLGSNRSLILVTHYQRLLNYIEPDFVHVLSNGKIVKSGGKELALMLEEKGYKEFI